MAFSQMKLKIIVTLFTSVFIVLSIQCCQPKTTSSDQSTKFNQYYIQGEQLYEKHCSNCHQKNGRGLKRIYPPLDTSDYMDQHVEKVICAMKYGISEEIIVNGRMYHQPMKGIASLTELEIAEISTYIYNTWSHKKGLIDVKETTRIISTCTH